MEFDTVIVEGQVNTIEAGVEAWKKEYEEASAAYCIEMLVRVYLDLCRFLEDRTERKWRELLENKITDIRATGTATLKGLNAVLGAARSLQSCINLAKQNAYLVDQSIQFEEATEKIKHSRDDLTTRWPWIDEKRLGESIADEKRGVRRSPAKEVFDELRRRVR